MATLNPILVENANKKIYVNDTTQEFIVSGYRLMLDPRLNRDTILVTVPTSEDSIGIKGNIAFDNNHMYYCVDQNKWVRTKLASWDNKNYILPPATGVAAAGFIPAPSHWWPFTSNGNSILGNYNFNAYNHPSFGTYGLTTAGYQWLLNCTSNIVEPSTVNENFTISFETKRTTNGFLMGCPFGKLGFSFYYVDRSTRQPRGDFTSTGPNLAFAFGTHPSKYSYQWSSAASTSSISTSSFSQIVAVNDATNKVVKIYVNGTLEETTSYTAPGTIYQNPQFQGFGIGASAQGICGVEYISSTYLKNMGFWKGTVLTQSQITSLYNGGNFKSYPFI